jgi:hypothetical protein
MKKLLIAAIVLSTAVIGLGACGSGGSDRAKSCPKGMTYEDNACQPGPDYTAEGTSVPTTAPGVSFFPSPTPPTTAAPVIQTSLPPERILAGCAQAHAAYATAQQRPLTNNDVLQVTLGFVPTFEDSQLAGDLLQVVSGLAFANQPGWVSTLRTLDAWCTSRGV